MRKFFRKGLLRLTIFWLNGILNGTGHRIVDTQDGTLHEVDLTGSITPQTRSVTDALWLEGIEFNPAGIRHARGIVDFSRFGLLVGGRSENGDAGIMEGIASQ